MNALYAELDRRQARIEELEFALDRVADFLKALLDGDEHEAHDLLVNAGEDMEDVARTALRKTEATDLRYATFEGFEIAMTLEEALSASHQGPCDEEVAALLDSLPISSQLDEIGPEAIRDELRNAGAWDEGELADDQANRKRIAWIAAGNIREEATT